MKRKLTTVAVAIITSNGAPLAKSCAAAICADPAKIIQLMAQACQGDNPAEIAAAPQTMPKGMMLISMGAKARTPAINSLREFEICGIEVIYE